MRLALGYNPVLSVQDAVAQASRAESLGYDSVWMHESLYQRDVVTYISAMASGTKRIGLGSGVINTFTRHPVTAATTFATLSELSGGRVTLGLGLGSFPTIPLIGQKIFPVAETKPIRRIKEYVEVVKSVWEGGKVDFDGDFFQVHGLTLGFRVDRRVPIFVASLSPKTQEFAATVADGVILAPALSTALATQKMVENVRRGEAKRGRGVERASYLLTSVDRDPAKAAKAVRDYYFFAYQLAEVVKPESLSPYGVEEEDLRPMKEAWRSGDEAEARRLIPEAAVEALTVTGTPDHALGRVDEYRKAGITLPILMPIGDVDYAVNELAPGG
ncbi:MAG: LLM class flavin-dependent oxidoreductase [Nitrososphaerota archaeon]|nr:LLM class flavin-dependent oxidoreductase [Nitrososphaerota archaeon]MDG6982597.1 LLM class flavin-dependent oxidoreductase [Nitrososphaerota archaeon]